MVSLSIQLVGSIHEETILRGQHQLSGITVSGFSMSGNFLLCSLFWNSNKC